MFSVGTEAGTVLGIEAATVHRAIMVDGGFFLPLSVIKSEDFDDLIPRGCHKVFSVKAEAGIAHGAIMLDGGFFLPLPVIKPVDFGGVIVRGCHKVFSVGAETGIDHAVRMLDGDYRFTKKKLLFCLILEQ